jgi:hypothetical protein
MPRVNLGPPEHEVGVCPRITVFLSGCKLPMRESCCSQGQNKRDMFANRKQRPLCEPYMKMLLIWCGETPASQWELNENLNNTGITELDYFLFLTPCLSKIRYFLIVVFVSTYLYYSVFLTVHQTPESARKQGLTELLLLLLLIFSILFNTRDIFYCRYQNFSYRELCDCTYLQSDTDSTQTWVCC